MNSENTLLEALCIEIKYASDQKVEATMPVDNRTRQPFGLLHGGASVALAETVASLGAFKSIDPQRELCVGLEINANHVRGKKEGIVRAIGIPLHKGKKTAIWEVKIVDEQDQLICISRCTLAILPK
ncbi:hotdog fold thioesterase [Priestia megaterium]|nr:hotdog fold thioesterase [Priestia megaterium]